MQCIVGQKVTHLCCAFHILLKWYEMGEGIFSPPNITEFMSVQVEP